MEAIYEINLKIALLQLNTSQYLSRIEGSPPKRNAAGSIPVMDASKQRCKPLFSRVYSFFCYHGQGSKYIAAYVRGNF